MSKNSRLFVEDNDVDGGIEIVEEIVEKHAEGTSTLYRVSTGILKKPFSRYSTFVRSFYIRLFFRASIRGSF